LLLRFFNLLFIFISFNLLLRCVPSGVIINCRIHVLGKSKNNPPFIYRSVYICGTQYTEIIGNIKITDLLTVNSMAKSCYVLSIGVNFCKAPRLEATV